MESVGNTRSLRSGELAALAKVSTDTLRHYERIGILPKPARTLSGYRVYSANSLDRVLLVRRALSLGFTLAELAKIMKIRDSGGAPCQQVQALARAKLAQVEDQLVALSELRARLQALISDWDQRLDQASGRRAGLLETLRFDPAQSSMEPPRLRKARTP